LLALSLSAAAASMIRPAGGWAAMQEGTAERVLPNGLLVVAEERPTTGNVALQLMARAGSRDDGDLPGVTLLTSRMMYQGTSRRPSETDLQRVAAAVGGSLSRGTSTEWSSYSSVMPAREAELAFDLIADIIGDPLLEPDAFDRQRQIALQELGQRRANPDVLMDDLFLATLLGSHPASVPVVGTPGSVRLIGLNAIVERRDRLFGASNLVLAVVGRIHPDEAFALAERYFGSLPAGEANAREPAVAEPPSEETAVSATGGEQQAQFRIGFLAPGLLEADRYPLVVLNALMNGSSGRLFRSLRSARGLAYYAGSAYTTYTDGGAWYATAEVDPSNIDRAIQATRDEIVLARETLPEASVVVERISQIAGRQILADETNSARATRLATQRTLGTESTDEYVRRVRQVTPADVLRVAQTYLDPDRSVVVVVTPG
jgi:zinc protease